MDLKQITPDEGEKLLNLAIPCVRALACLVKLQKMKVPEEFDEYIARQPEAWKIAMEALDDFERGYGELFSEGSYAGLRRSPK